MPEKKQNLDLKKHYQKYLSQMWRKAPFVLRITEWKDYPVPVLVVKERYDASEEDTKKKSGISREPTGRLVERGRLAGESQRRCLPVLRRLLERVRDDASIPLELHRYLSQEGLKLRLNLPLDEEAGAKAALIFRLQERVDDLERVELIARRVANFTREEAAYWLSRTTSYGDDANRWAVSGLRIMMGGQPNDPGIEKMLERLRDIS